MGFFVGVLNSVVVAFQNSQFKKLSGASTYVLNWFRFTVAAGILAVLVTLFSEWSFPPLPFWLLVLCVSLPLEVLIAFGYARAFQVSPQSLIGPLFSLVPIFLLPISFLLNGESPSFLGLAGILSAVFGALALGWDAAHPGVAKALKNIFQEQGSYLMVGAAVCAAFSVSVAKYSYQYAPPLLFAFYITVALMLAHTPAIFLKSFSDLKSKWRSTFFMAGAYGVGMALHYVGLSLLLAVYYISIKRLSIVFDVILGRVIHGEDHFQRRLVGALFMLGGVLLIALA